MIINIHTLDGVVNERETEPLDFTGTSETYTFETETNDCIMYRRSKVDRLEREPDVVWQRGETNRPVQTIQIPPDGYEAYTKKHAELRAKGHK